MRFLTILMAVSLIWAPVANASDDSKVAHYEGIDVGMLEQAYTVLATQTAAMQQAVAAKDWDAVHKVSYDLEEALEFVEEYVEETQEALEEVHEASEEYDEKAVAEAFDDYTSQLEGLLSNQCIK